MKWDELVTILLIGSNFIYSIFRFLDYFHQKSYRETETAFHDQQLQFNNRVTEILEDQLIPKG